MVNSCHFIHSVNLRPGDLHHGRIRTVWKVANVTLGEGGGGDDASAQRELQVRAQLLHYASLIPRLLWGGGGGGGGGGVRYKAI